MKKKTGLGRGLGMLLPDIPDDIIGEAQDKTQVREIPLGDIDPNRAQPRKRFDDESLRQLADSIAHSGVIQPILVYEQEGRYQIIAGERRWRAARLAGLTTIPAIIRDYDRIKQMEVALVENIQRENLNPVEEAQAIRALMDECGLTQEAVAAQLGRSRPAIANLLRILSLPKELLVFVSQGTLTAGHARVLAGVEKRARQMELCKLTIANGWSVRQLEQEAQKDPAKVVKKPASEPIVELTTLEDNLRDSLGLRAKITGNLKKGRIVLQYSSEDELESFYEMIERMRS